MSEFVNPDNLPIEKLKLNVDDGGVLRQVSAIDPFLAEKTKYILYEKPPSGTDNVAGAIETWKSKINVYINNLKLLLSLEHYRFWSTVVHNGTCMDALVSFLQEANPPYMPSYESSINSVYQDIRRSVLIVFCRLITNKESKAHWMSKDHMRDLIYDKFIFTVPILWDLCLVYGADNTQNVARLLDSVFTLQPKYIADLGAAVAFVKESFKYIILQVNKDYDTPEPPNLPETFKGFSEIHRPPNSKDEKISIDMLRDLVLHLLDTVMTLRIFAEAYPRSVEVLKKRGMILSIVQIYEHAFPHIYERLEEAGVSGDSLAPLMDNARAESVDVVREILAAPKNAIFSGEGNIENHVEEYLSLMLDLLSERLLARDYNSCYPVHEDVELLRHAYPNIDQVKTDFILQAVYSNIDEPVPERHTQPQLNGDNTHTHTETEVTHTHEDIPVDIRQDSLISEVKDILPHLGNGFILKCLEHYGFNSSTVINRVLEDTLDDSLRKLDRDLPIIPVDPVDKQFLETGIERLNVFDGDEFDIMTRDDVDLTKIHTGKKKGKYKNLKEMLDDKTDVKMMQDIYMKYNLVCDEENMYSDEYDDTYDDEAPPPAASDGDDLGRPFVTPRALAARQRAEESSSEEEQPSEAPSGSGSGNNRNKLDFCQNPEEMRARREANWRLKQGKGHRPPPKPVDVTGKPKGQGQEKEVLQSRDRKEKHKGTRANHNRRSGATWKRSQGMVPS